MKPILKVVFLSQLVVGAFAEDLAQVDRAIAESKQPITPNFYNGSIHLSDLSTSAAAGGAMYTISAPGRYYVAGDLGIAPTNSRVAAIKITASNVFLDLNDMTIYQRSGNSQTGLMGIEIASGVANVRIINGVINGLNVSDATEQNAGVVVSSSANNITIEDVVVMQCTSDTKEVAGFLLSSCNSVKLVNCEANANSNSLATATDNSGMVNGFKLSSASNCVLQNCLAIANGSADHHAHGFRIESSNYNSFIECRAINQSTTSNDSGDMATGFYCNASAGNLFEKCIATGNVAGTSSGALAVGFYLIGTTTYATISHCLAQSNSGGSGTGYGILVASTVSDCNVTDNFALSNTGTVAGYGIVDAGSTNTMYTSNFAHSNRIPSGLVSNYNGSVGQVSTATHSNYNNLDNTRTGYNNLEIS